MIIVSDKFKNNFDRYFLFFFQVYSIIGEKSKHQPEELHIVL